MHGSDFGLSNTSRQMEQVVQSVETDEDDDMVLRPQHYLQMQVCYLQVYAINQTINLPFYTSNVKNIYRRRRMSRVRIGGAGGRRNARPCRVQQRTVQFSDVVVAELFVTGDREFQTAGAVILNALDWKLILVAG